MIDSKKSDDNSKPSLRGWGTTRDLVSEQQPKESYAPAAKKTARTAGRMLLEND